MLLSSVENDIPATEIYRLFNDRRGHSLLSAIHF